jgi:hypothetical protein
MRAWRFELTKVRPSCSTDLILRFRTLVSRFLTNLQCVFSCRIESANYIIVSAEHQRIHLSSPCRRPSTMKPITEDQFTTLLRWAKTIGKRLGDHAKQFLKLEKDLTEEQIDKWWDDARAQISRGPCRKRNNNPTALLTNSDAYLQSSNTLPSLLRTSIQPIPMILQVPKIHSSNRTSRLTKFRKVTSSHWLIMVNSIRKKPNHHELSLPTVATSAP